MSKLTPIRPLAIAPIFFFAILAGCAVQPQPNEQVLVSSAEAAQTEQSTATETVATTETAAATEDDPLICRREAPIGSRFRKKVCLRQSVRDAQAQESQDLLREGGRASQAGTPGG